MASAMPKELIRNTVGPRKRPFSFTTEAQRFLLSSRRSPVRGGGICISPSGMLPSALSFRASRATKRRDESRDLAVLLQRPFSHHRGAEIFVVITTSRAARRRDLHFLKRNASRALSFRASRATKRRLPSMYFAPFMCVSVRCVDSYKFSLWDRRWLHAFYWSFERPWFAVYVCHAQNDH